MKPIPPQFTHDGQPITTTGLRAAKPGQPPQSVGLPAAAGQPFDAVERKLSLALDALLDAIDTYRELT